MGMSTLAVKPRDRVRCRAKAGDSGLAEPKARAPVGSFLKPDKELAGGHRDYGSGRATTLGHTINDLRQERARSLRRGVAGKSHLKDFHLDGSRSPNSTPLGANSSSFEPTARGLIRGDWAMWIIWYIGMMASLRAMGLAPSPVPIRTDENRKPYGDF